MKRILKALLTLALAMAVTLAIGASSLCSALEPDDAPAASGYLVILRPAPQSFFGDVSLFGLPLLEDDGEVPENLTLLSESCSIYKAAQLADIEELVWAGRVELAEPDYEVELFDVTPEPNDSYFNVSTYQYNLRNNATGIRVQSAWDAGLSGNGVTVAVIDSGLNADHLDAPAKLGIGRYFYYREFDPVADAAKESEFRYTFSGSDKKYGYFSSSDTTDNNGHGTAVSGIIAAKTDNNVAIAGIAPNVTLIPIRCFTRTKGHLGGYSSNMISGLEYAVTQHADIINMSWGIKSDSQALQTAVTAAASAGCILVAAVGNDGNGTYNYPANYPNVIGVGSTMKDRASAADFSQKNDSVDVFAPGEVIYSLGFSSPTAIASGSGTSFSAPQVAAVAALLKEANPQMTHTDFLALLRSHSTPLAAGSVNTAYNTKRAGVLNVRQLLDAVGAVSFNVTGSFSGYSLQACFHPADSQNLTASNYLILLAGYNDTGHLVASAITDAQRSSAYGGYRSSATFSRTDIATVRAFFLKKDASLAAILPPVERITGG